MLRRLLRLLPAETLDGYEHPELVETVFRKTIAYSPTQHWPEMQGVQSALDFGGGCGRHYREAKNSSESIKWAIVETAAMVARAKELETSQLRFFTEIDEAAEWLGDVEVVHSNGAIQYAPDPISIVKKLCSVGARRMLWDRVFLGDGRKVTQVALLGDNGPGQIKAPRKKTSYQQTTVPEDAFLAEHGGYRLVERGDDWFRFVK